MLEAGASRLSLRDLAEFCRQRGLANQKIPERIEIVDALPRNPLGKVLKRELRATYGSVPSVSERLRAKDAMAVRDGHVESGLC